METMIQPFSFEGRQVRVVGDAESPRWVASDVCAILDVDTSESVARLDPDEKGTDGVGTPGGLQQMLTVTEPGLYALVARSRKPEAKRFDRWVRHDVLPAIRRTGSYSAALPESYEQLMVRALHAADERVKLLEAVNADLTPKAEAWEELVDAKGTVCLQQAGKDLGLPPNLFIRWLRHCGHIYSRGKSTLAREDHVNSGRMVHRIVVVGDQKITQTRMTPQGVKYFGERRPEMGRAKRLHAHPAALAPAFPGATL